MSEGTRIFFCTDLHGSEICFRKFLHAGKAYQAGVVIMGGDCTGKMIVPMVEDGGGGLSLEWAGRQLHLTDGDEIAEQEKMIKNNGFYPVRIDGAEMEALSADPERVSRLFTQTMVETLRTWTALAKERLGDSGLKVVITPGNDDEFEVDEVLRESDFVEAAEGRVVRIDDVHEMLSLGWANPTPWETPRECSEEELTEKIRVLAEQVENMETAIFNIHVPPHGTGLDSAPELEEGKRLKRGGAIQASVGSTAVHEAIAQYQPLLSLHGHIHESRGMQKIGRTVAINPGSSYSDWTLQGVIVDIDGSTVERYLPTTG